MGPITDNHYSHLTDATWNERMAAGILVTGIVAIGVAPFWLYHLINPGTEYIIHHIGEALIIK